MRGVHAAPRTFQNPPATTSTPTRTRWFDEPQLSHLRPADRSEPRALYGVLTRGADQTERSPSRFDQDTGRPARRVLDAPARRVARLRRVRLIRTRSGLRRGLRRLPRRRRIEEPPRGRSRGGLRGVLERSRSRDRLRVAPGSPRLPGGRLDRLATSTRSRRPSSPRAGRGFSPRFSNVAAMPSRGSQPAISAAVIGWRVILQRRHPSVMKAPSPHTVDGGWARCARFPLSTSIPCASAGSSLASSIRSNPGE